MPIVTLIDRYERYVAMVELHEVDQRGMARVRRMAADGRSGQWLTVTPLLLRFDRSQDRAALIAQARDRHAATQSRRAALHHPHGETDNV